jgi:hypothetical protein
LVADDQHRARIAALEPEAPLLQSRHLRRRNAKRSLTRRYWLTTLHVKGFSMNFKAALAVVLVCGVIPFAFAEDKSAPITVNVTPPTCEKPGDPPLQPTADQQRRFDKKRDAYKSCVMGFVDDMKKQAIAHEDAARKYADAANNAINEYNTWASEFNATLNKK